MTSNKLMPALSPRARRIWITGILTFSSVSTLVGTAALFAFNQTAGEIGAVPVRWPASSYIQRPARGGALLVFVHPYCSCSAATIDEIASLAASGYPRDGRPSITVAFFRPKNSAWKPDNLWGRVERELPGAHPVWDDEGNEAKRFGVRTSGYTLFYNAGGELLFKGGVTASRGHGGDNFGIEGLRDSLESGRPAPHASLVFGCALAGAEAPNGGKQ